MIKLRGEKLSLLGYDRDSEWAGDAANLCNVCVSGGESRAAAAAMMMHEQSKSFRGNRAIYVCPRLLSPTLWNISTERVFTALRRKRYTKQE